MSNKRHRNRSTDNGSKGGGGGGSSGGGRHDLEEVKEHLLPMCCRTRLPRQIESDDDVAPGRASMVNRRGNLWERGTTLTYYFFRPDETLDKIAFTTDGKIVIKRNKVVNNNYTKVRAQNVRDAFAQWEKLGLDLKFLEVPLEDKPMIRISFEEGDGCWSYVGRELVELNSYAHAATMNFGWEIESDERGVYHVAAHEIGHSLGFDHEHQNPSNGIVWDVPKVLALYRATQGPKWTDSMTYSNVIDKVPDGVAESTQFDPRSIMCYGTGPGLILEPAALRGGFDPTKLNGGPKVVFSPLDIEWARKCYAPIGSAGSSGQPEVLSPGVMIPLEGDKVFSITPPKTKTYTIQTAGRVDSKMSLFQGSKLLQAVTDRNRNLNATMKVKLVAGQKYTLRHELLWKYPEEDEVYIQMV